MTRTALACPFGDASQPDGRCPEPATFVISRGDPERIDPMCPTHVRLLVAARYGDPQRPVSMSPGALAELYPELQP